jgi:L-ascorbate metabolism protein UlaG (beta-lactamase superfamily)
MSAGRVCGRIGRAVAPLAITWVGHATVLIELDGVRLLTDPVLRGRVGPLLRVAAPPAPGVDAGIDGVLLSHLHADHVDPPSLRGLSATPAVAGADACRWLTARGLSDVRGLRPGEVAEFGPVSVTATPATHDARRRPLGGPRAEPMGYVVRGSRSVYFAGDTDLFEAMRDLRGLVDVALLPVWGWGPSLGTGHLGPESAAQAAALIAPAVAIPIHWGTFVVAPLAWTRRDDERPAREFSAFAQRDASGVEVRVLAPGERVVV